MLKITSAQNPLIKHLARLQQKRRMRYANRSCVIEGVKMVNEVCEKLEATCILVDDPDLLSPKLKAKTFVLASHEILQKIAGSKNPEGIVAEVPFPEEKEMSQISFLVALDGISDPGNMGTLIRTALAFGWEGVFLLPNCCDPFNDKALRGAKGATFHLPLKFGNWSQLEKIATVNHLQMLAADVEGKNFHSIAKFEKILLVFGSEAKGLSEITRRKCERITIPMEHQQMESLNVAVAGGILMYHLRGSDFVFENGVCINQ